MPTLLEPCAHNALVARWAWYACLDSISSLREGDDAFRTAQEMIERIVAGEAAVAEPVPPAQYAEILLARIRASVCGPFAAARELILNSYRPYLRTLTPTNGDPFERLCEVAASAAVAYYKHHKVKLPRDLISGLRIMIDHDPEPPSQTFEAPFVGEAQVLPGCHVEKCCASTKKHLQTLHLTLIPAGFDSGSLSALPFVLFHECVSHVLQGPWAGERKSPDPASQFAEGWMDLAARAVFEHVLHRRSPFKQVVLFPYQHRWEFFERGGRLMCDARHSVSVRMSRAAARRCEGWRAANDTLQAMQRAGLPDEVFLRLSFQLNVSDLSPAARDIVVQRFGAVFQPDPRSARRSETTMTVSALKKYADDGRLDLLLDVVGSTARLNGSARRGWSVSRTDLEP